MTFPIIRHGRSQGMTLIELSVSVGLVALIGMTVFALLLNGLKLWDRSRAEPPFLDLALFVDTFHRDIENSFVYPQLVVHGDETSFYVPGSICGELKDEEAGPCLGLIRYSHDPKSGVVARTFLSLSDVLTSGQGSPQTLMTKVSSLVFSYDLLDVTREEVVRSPVWPPAEGVPKDPVWPRVVRVEGTFERGGKTYAWKRMYEFPLAASSR